MRIEVERLELMSAKELKAIAKELKIKDWWTKSKFQLVADIKALQVEEEPTETIEEFAGQDSLEDQEADANLVPMPGIEKLAELKKEYPNKKKDNEPTEKKARGKQIEFGGKSMNLNEWAKELGMTRQTLYARLYIQNWDVEKAFTTPGRKAK